MLKGDLRLMRMLTLTAALATGFLMGSLLPGVAVLSAQPTPQVKSHTKQSCPPQSDLDSALREASALMQQARFQDAAVLLQPISNCDVRASLLLAAALEGQGDELHARLALQHAHSAWPLNNSVAASLARAYLSNGEKDKAAKALADFHATAETPEQEMEMAVVVYLSAQKLVFAQKIAEENYKDHSSLHSLLLLANALQLQGRYPDVNRLLGDKRAMYSSSPEFLVTLAESEFDASSFAEAREDLQHAIALNAQMYQAHYLLGNVLVKMNEQDGAITEYRQAIELAPKQPRTYFQLALVLESKQDEAGEQKLLEQALQADDHYAPAHNELGRILLEEHRPADAVNHFLAAIRDNPRSEKSYYLLARAYAQMGQKDNSSRVLKQLQAVREQNHLSTNNRAESQPVAN